MRDCYLKLIRQKNLYYWASSGTAEVDFLIEKDQNILPLDVKAGVDKKKKSLLVYAEKYSPRLRCSTTLMNFKLDGKIINYPLYIISLMHRAIYIFDESTSSLDAKTEQSILKNIRTVTHDATTLMITHRLSSIIDADEIHVLEKGTIAERGTHEELLESRVTYAHLWFSQNVPNYNVNKVLNDGHS